MELAARLILGTVLLLAGTSKLRAPREGAAAMAVYGFGVAPLRWIAFAVVVSAEIGLSIGVLAGSDRASYAAAALMALFALTLVSALMQGRAGEPCGCFGPKSTVSVTAVARNVLMAVAFGVLPSL